MKTFETEAVDDLVIEIPVDSVRFAPTPDYVVSDVTHVRVWLFSTPGR
jgi:hypothetical protein